MSATLIIISIFLIVVVIFQFAKLVNTMTRLKGEKAAFLEANEKTAVALLIFMILLMILSVGSMFYYKNYMLGYGPLQIASIHGREIHKNFNVTLIATGIVYVITQILLFYFAFKYRFKEGRKALFMPHDNKLEIIWTAAPTVVMAYLVISGLVVWNKVMADVKPDSKTLEIEATGMQFAWIIRYPGPDGMLGSSNFKMITGENDLGQDWKDKKNLDDFKPDEIVLPKDQQVRVRIKARDVLHSFFLPHFSVKMDAVPGLPTYFVFTPNMTTEEYRANLSRYPEWNVPADPTDPGGKKKWETFNFELACAELCGTSHFAMRRVVRIVTDAEYKKWLSEQKSFYLNNIAKSEDASEVKTSDSESKDEAKPESTDSSKVKTTQDTIH